MATTFAAQKAPPPQILLIGNNEHGHTARKIVLEQESFEVSTASTPEQGLAKLRQTGFDLVITGFNMRGSAGTEVIARIRAERPNVPIIVLSSMVDALGLDEKNTGADAVIAKGANEVAHMIRAVKRLLTKKKKPPQTPAGQRARMAAS